jgi:hypothetical protein
MTWVRLDDLMPQHPKVLRAGPAAAWLWVCGLAYCSRMLTDGAIPSQALASFGLPQTDKLAATLVEVGLWDETSDGFQVHDFLQYQPSRKQVLERRERATARVKEWRKRRGYSHGDADCNAVGNGVGNAVGNGVGNAVGNAAPDPDPDPKEKEHARNGVTAEDPTPSESERAGEFVRWYETRYAEVRQSAYFRRPSLDYDHACRLTRTYPDDAWLRDMAEVYLLTNHPDAQRASRTIGQFTTLAGWCDARLRETGRRPKVTIPLESPRMPVQPRTEGGSHLGYPQSAGGR